MHCDVTEICLERVSSYHHKYEEMNMTLCLYSHRATLRVALARREATILTFDIDMSYDMCTKLVVQYLCNKIRLPHYDGTVLTPVAPRCFKNVPPQSHPKYCKSIDV